MYYILHEDFLFRSWRDLSCALVNTKSGRIHMLPDSMETILECCDGSVDMQYVLMDERQRELFAELAQREAIIPLPSAGTIGPIQKRQCCDYDFVHSIHWSITGKCNLRCRHCYLSAPHAKYDDLSFSEICSVIRQIREAEIYQVSITGGEPLVRTDFWEIMRELKQQGITVTHLFTNGLLVDDKFLDQARAEGMHWEFVLSFDGLGTHDWLRGLNGTESKTLSSIARIRDAGYPVSIESAVHGGNVHTLLPTYQKMKELGIKFWKISTIMETGEWKLNSEKNAISQTLLLEHYRQLIGQLEADGMPMSVQLDGFYSTVKGSLKHSVPYRMKAEQDRYSCDSCIRQPYLLPDGRLLPCPSFTDTEWEKEMPTVKTERLKNILSSQSSAFYKITHIRSQEVIAHNPTCGDCKHALSCGGGCRALAILSGNGPYGIANNICAYFKSEQSLA